MLIRNATKEDINAVHALECAYFSADPWTKQMFIDYLKEPTSLKLFVAEIDGKVVAYSCLRLIGVEAEIDNLAVCTNFRKQGIGEKLLLKMLEKAKKTGAKDIFLEVEVDNLPAQNLYEKHGFKIVAKRKCYYGDKDAYTYGKPLADH